MTGPWLKPSDAAAYVGMSYKAFDAWVRRKGVQFGRIGRNRRFSKPYLDRLMNHFAEEWERTCPRG